jgi:hypothetical protein
MLFNVIGAETSMRSDRQLLLIACLDKRKAAHGLIIGSLLFATHVHAQVTGFGRSSAPIYGGTGIAAQPASPFQPMQGTFAAAHKTSDGKPCISVSPSARAQAVNPKIIDQVVLVNNVCGQPIKVQVCYPKSSDCITVALEGFQKLQRILGIGSSPAFAYEYRELF